MPSNNTGGLTVDDDGGNLGRSPVDDLPDEETRKRARAEEAALSLPEEFLTAQRRAIYPQIAALLKGMREPKGRRVVACVITTVNERAAGGTLFGGAIYPTSVLGALAETEMRLKNVFNARHPGFYYFAPPGVQQGYGDQVQVRDGESSIGDGDQADRDFEENTRHLVNELLIICRDFYGDADLRQGLDTVIERALADIAADKEHPDGDLPGHGTDEAPADGADAGGDRPSKWGDRGKAEED